MVKLILLAFAIALSGVFKALVTTLPLKLLIML
jgi:hypothetical protein